MRKNLRKKFKQGKGKRKRENEIYLQNRGHRKIRTLVEYIPLSLQSLISAQLSRFPLLLHYLEQHDGVENHQWDNWLLDLLADSLTKVSVLQLFAVYTFSQLARGAGKYISSLVDWLRSVLCSVLFLIVQARLLQWLDNEEYPSIDGKPIMYKQTGYPVVKISGAVFYIQWDNRYMTK